jgi:hypothetical protein
VLGRDDWHPGYSVSLLAGLPFEQTVVSLEHMLEREDAQERLIDILSKVENLAQDPHDGVLLNEENEAELYVSFTPNAAYYYIVNGDRVFPFGVKFYSDHNGMAPGTGLCITQNSVRYQVREDLPPQAGNSETYGRTFMSRFRAGI